MTSSLIPERVSELDELSLDRGGHGSFREGHCATETIAWLAGEAHTDQPQCVSPALAAFLRGLNDVLGDEERQRLKPYLLKAVGTRDDQDEARGWLATDWSIRVSLPTWLELAGATEAAEKLRALPPITKENIDEVRPQVVELREKGWERRKAAQQRLRDKAYTAVKERLADKGWSDVADAAYATNAAAKAANAAAYVANAADYAADYAANVANAADYAADYAANVANAADYAAAYAADYAANVADGAELRAKIREAVREKVAEKLAPTQQALLLSALDLLERMIDPSAGE